MGFKSFAICDCLFVIVGKERFRDLRVEKFSKADTLILVALESELPRESIPHWNVRYIGVGKVNAALGVCRFVQEFKPTKIINFGTAGSLKDNLTGLVEATSFYQRDMDARPMGFFLGQTPFEDDICIYLDRPGVSCGSGDSFVTSTPELLTDIVDMEAFALAKFARQAGIDFHCFKYISDSADSDAPKSWKDSVISSSEIFIKEVLNQIT